MEKYYRYNGSLQKCEMQEIIIKIITKSVRNKNRFILRDEFSKILSNDEFIEMKLSVKETIKTGIHVNIVNKLALSISYFFPHCTLFKLPLIIPVINVNINIKAATVSILALLLDLDTTKGFLSAFLALSGFNNKAFSKLDEFTGEKCLLIEICSKSKHKANISIFNDICEKECINNNLKCKYRAEGKCLMKLQDVVEKCNGLVERNVLKKEGNEYCYIFWI